MRHCPFRRALTALLALSSVFATTGCGQNWLIFNPVGPVGQKEEDLINLSIILVLIVVIPVLVLMWYIVWRYRDKPGNDAPYNPHWSESTTLEVIWWGIPIVIIGTLAAFTIRTTFALTRPPEKNATPVTIDVISLDWKWLFLYPDQKLATVNVCHIPTNRPVQFVLTADAPFNSFWVPQLGGQEYTMPGMAMRLWLQANKPGTYFGSAANFTGEGYSHMKFNVIAENSGDFARWVSQVHQTSPALTVKGYEDLRKRSVIDAPVAYSSYPSGIFHDVVMRDGGMYMKHDKVILEENKQ